MVIIHASVSTFVSTLVVQICPPPRTYQCFRGLHSNTPRLVSMWTHFPPIVVHCPLGLYIVSFERIHLKVLRVQFAHTSISCESELAFSYTHFKSESLVHLKTFNFISFWEGHFVAFLRNQLCTQVIVTTINLFKIEFNNIFLPFLKPTYPCYLLRRMKRCLYIINEVVKSSHL